MHILLILVTMHFPPNELDRVLEHPSLSCPADPVRFDATAFRYPSMSVPYYGEPLR